MFILEDNEIPASDITADPSSVVDLAMATDDDYNDKMDKFDITVDEDDLLDDEDDLLDGNEEDLFSDDTIGTSFDPVDMEIDADILEDIELLDVVDDIFDYVI